MTDPIREIIEELKRICGPRMHVTAYPLVAEEGKGFETNIGCACHLASRLSAYWTPERAAFMEGAMTEHALYHPKDTKQNAQNHAVTHGLYRALVESEKRDGD